jgi:hypothetical protein
MPKSKRKRRSTNASGYFGVTLIGKRYRAQIYSDGKVKNHGTYDTAKQAAKACDAAAIELGRPLSKLNFPNKVPSGYTPTDNGQISTNTSGYRGVSKTKYGYRAQIKIKGKQKHLGTFKTRKQAAIAYDHAVHKHGLPTSRLNFPNKDQPSSSSSSSSSTSNLLKSTSLDEESETSEEEVSEEGGQSSPVVNRFQNNIARTWKKGSKVCPSCKLFVQSNVVLCTICQYIFATFQMKNMIQSSRKRNRQSRFITVKDDDSSSDSDSGKDSEEDENDGTESDMDNSDDFVHVNDNGGVTSDDSSDPDSGSDSEEEDSEEENVGRHKLFSTFADGVARKRTSMALLVASVDKEKVVHEATPLARSSSSTVTIIASKKKLLKITQSEWL